MVRLKLREGDREPKLVQLPLELKIVKVEEMLWGQALGGVFKKLILHSGHIGRHKETLDNEQGVWILFSREDETPFLTELDNVNEISSLHFKRPYNTVLTFYISHWLDSLCLNICLVE
jgi:hypothetical protein